MFHTTRTRLYRVERVFHSPKNRRSGGRKANLKLIDKRVTPDLAPERRGSRVEIIQVRCPRVT